MDKRQLRDLHPSVRRLAYLGREIQGISRRVDHLVDEISSTIGKGPAVQLGSIEGVAGSGDPFCPCRTTTVCLVTWHPCRVDPVTSSSDQCLFRNWWERGGPDPVQAASARVRPGGPDPGGIPLVTPGSQPGILEHPTNVDQAGQESDLRSVRTEGSEIE